MTKNLRNLSLNLLIAGICIHAAAAPADTNSLIERIASDAKVPPILVKAIAWQESKWQHLDAPGRIKISSDGGVGIMQIQGGDRNQSEEQNIRAGVAALQIKWQLNISTNARAAVDKLGGVAEDYQSDILENWFVPLAAYNGYSGTGVNGQGGGKGYARAIYSLVRNPTSYQNWRTDGRTEAVSSALLGFFRPNVDITDPKIIPGVDGGTAKNIQAYSLCQLIQNGGKIHRYDFQTQTIVEVTGSVRPKCNISGPQSPVVGLPLLRNVTSGLVPVMPGQAMSFSVTVDNVALVDRVEVFFPDANLAEPAVQNGNIYTRTRIMQRPGENRPFVMRVYPSGSQTPVVAEGRYTVAAVVMTGAVTNPTPASIATPTATPQVVGGQQVVQLVHPLANYPIARILADPRYSGAFNAEHTGIDIMAPVGTAVKAMCAGNIERNRTQRDVGNAVLIVRHTCGSQQLFGYYGHIASDLQANTRVLAGQTLGIVRQNGSNNHHLHFGLQTNFVEVGWGRAPRNTTREAMLAAGWLDPLEYLRNKVVLTEARVDPNEIPPTQRVSRENFGVGLLNAIAYISSKYSGAPEQKLRASGLIQAEFRGGEAIIRADAVRMTYRLIERHANLSQLLAGKAQNRFDQDADLDDDALLRQNANALASLGIFNGYQNGTIAELEPARQLSNIEQSGIITRLQSLNWATSSPNALPSASLPTLSTPTQSTIKPIITSVQTQGQLMTNTPGILVFSGQNLSSAVRVTLANCENPKTQLLSSTQISHECVPQQAGNQMAGWKPDASTPAPININSIMVQDHNAGMVGGTVPAKLDAFVATWRGKPVDFDKSWGFQCVDLMRFYARDVLGINNQFPRGNAHAIFTSINSSTSPSLHKVINTPSAVPAKGDVIFWVPSPANGNAGHVGIFVSGDANQFTSFDQNFCVNSGSGKGDCAPRLVTHSYNGVAGWVSTSLVTTPPIATPLVAPTVALPLQNTTPIAAKISNLTAPGQVQLNQVAEFNVLTTAPVQTVVVEFQNPNANLSFAGNGLSWRLAHPMQSPGSRPYTVKLLNSTGQTVDSRTGVLNVVAAPPNAQAPTTQAQTTQAAPPPPAAAPVVARIASLAALVQVQLNQAAEFNVQTTAPVQAVVIEFQNPNANLNFAGGGLSWRLTHPMQSLGSRPYTVKLLNSAGQIVDSRAGTLTVIAPPPPPPTVAKLANLAAPGQVLLNQIAEFNVQTTAPVQAVVIEFQNPNANLNFAGGGLSWRLTHTMQSPGPRPYTVKLLNGAGQVVDSRSGALTVVAPPAPAPQPLPAQAPIAQTPSTPIPNVTGASRTALLRVGNVGTFKISGSNLSAQVRVSLEGCDNGTIVNITPSEITYSCTVREKGMKWLFWKKPGLDLRINILQFEVL